LRVFKKRRSGGMRKIIIGKKKNGLKIIGIKCECCPTVMPIGEVSDKGLCSECQVKFDIIYSPRIKKRGSERGWS
jgi:hypothetical protein